MFTDINLLSIILASIAYMVIGALWYSPLLFGNLWMQELQIEWKKMEGQNKAMALGVVLGVVLSVGLSIVLSMIDVNSVDRAIETAFLLWIGIMLPVLGTGPIYEKQPVKVFVITAGYHLVALLSMAIIIVSFA
ncbi:MAG: DUF1761 domain-containing protein [Patescibacteria group bacterium]